MGIFEQMRLYTEESLMIVVFITSNISGFFNLIVGNVIGIVVYFLFLFCQAILGSPFLRMDKINWIMKLMFLSWIFCVLIMVAELTGIWPILVNFFGG